MLSPCLHEAGGQHRISYSGFVANNKKAAPKGAAFLFCVSHAA